MLAAVATAGLLGGVACGPADGDSTGDAGCPVSDGAAVVLDGSHVIVDRRPSSGTCRYVCADGWWDCTGYPTCGARHDDDANCGACGQACAAPWQNSAPTCRPGGICEFNCAPGWINCGGRIENGCERALDATDCRTCGNNCPYPLTCALDGRCVTS